MEKDKVSPDSSTHIASKRKRLRKKKEKEEHGWMMRLSLVNGLPWYN